MKRVFLYLTTAIAVIACAEERPSFGDSADGAQTSESGDDGTGDPAGESEPDGPFDNPSSESDEDASPGTSGPTGTPNAVPADTGGTSAPPVGSTATPDGKPTASTEEPNAVPPGPDPLPTTEPSELGELGDPCTSAQACGSGFCVDGVCCESACSETCARCDVPSQSGSCVAAESDPACGTLACPDDTDCRSYDLDPSVGNCAGVGSCASEASCGTNDAPLGTVCGSGANAGSCDGEGQCVVPNKAMLGESCNSGADCGSGFCAPAATGDTICCDGACDGTCQACSDQGHCDTAPPDDAACGVVQCPSDTSCVDYPASLTSNRCSGFNQCVSQAAYCNPSYASSSTSCGAGMVCDGKGDCEVSCPTTSGPSRTCTSDCPCTTGQGVCTTDADCVTGHVCTADAGAKLGFTGSSCMPAHCTNDQLDSGETSVDCGGECGCRATFEVVQLTGIPSGASFSQFLGMSGDGSTFVGNIARSRTSFPAVVSASGAVTELPNHGAGGGAYDASSDGSVVVGVLACADPPTCSDSTSRPYRWTNGGTPTALTTSGSARAVSSSGTVIVGDYYSGSANSVFRYANGVVTTVTALSYARAVSGNGSFIAGQLAADTNQYGVWSVQQAALLTLSPPAYWTSWVIQAINDNGTAFVGRGYNSSSNGTYPFVWTSGTFQEFDVPTNINSIPNDVSADGKVVVGRTGTNAAYQAFIWDSEAGLRTVLDELAGRGLELPSDIELRQAEFISSDGAIVAGTYGVGTDVSAWRAVLEK